MSVQWYVDSAAHTQKHTPAKRQWQLMFWEEGASGGNSSVGDGGISAPVDAVSWGGFILFFFPLYFSPILTNTLHNYLK